MMSQGAALAEARSRWGQTAALKKGKCYPWEPRKGKPPQPGCSSHGRECQAGQPSCRVGRIDLGLFFSVKGDGYTWEHAFAQADLQDHRMGHVGGHVCAECDRLHAAAEAHAKAWLAKVRR